jgi:hypothetical protein
MRADVPQYTPQEICISYLILKKGIIPLHTQVEGVIMRVL